VIAGGLIAGPAAQAAEYPEPLVAVLGDPNLTTEVDGTALVATSRVEETGEIIMQGETSDGSPYEVISVYGPPSSLEAVEPPVADATPQAGVVEAAAATPEGEAAVEVGVASLEPSAVDVSTFVPVATIARTDDSVSFAWAELEGAQRYVVTAGDVVEVASTPAFSASYDEMGVDAQFAEIDAIDAAGVSLQTNLIPIAGPDGSTLQPMGYQQYSTAYTYETFIPEARVAVDWMEAGACGGWPWQSVSFSGDGRGYRTPDFTWPYDEPDYRTMSMTIINWSNAPEYSILNGRGVGPTTMYVNGVASSTKTASTAGIVDDAMFRDGNYAQVRWTHNVGNPHCAAGSIRYQVTVGFYRNSGLIQVTGYRNPVPAHEIYGRWNVGATETWYSIMRRSNSGFHCLLGVCGNEVINLQVTH